jgi:hypothetical protein
VSTYPTLQDVRAYIGTVAATDDGLIQALMSAAQALIEGPHGADRRFLVANDTTRTFDALRDTSADRRTLYLDEDLCQITSITNGDGTTISASAYTLGPVRNRAPWWEVTIKTNTSGTVWTWLTAPEDAISITGRWGYSVTPPEDIQQTYRALVAYLYRRRSNSGDMDRPILGNDGLVIAPAQLPRDIVSVLKNYRERRKVT